MASLGQIIIEMKKNLFFCAIVAFVCAASCGSPEPAFEETVEIGPYTVSRIEENVWHIEDYNSSHPRGLVVKEDGSYSFNGTSDMYIVRGKKKAILIDLSNRIRWADDADEALRTIFYERAGKREKLITVTHNHGDHTGMYYAFKDEPDISFLLPVNDFQNDTVFKQKSLIGDRECIDLGGETIQCVQCEGHTPGSMVFFLKGHNYAFSGDAIGSGTGVWIFSVNGFEQYRKGIENLLSYLLDPASGIDPETFLFWGGHTYQNQGVNLGVQTVKDAKVLNDQIAEGTAEWEPYQTSMRNLDATFKYGEALLVWNKAQSEAYAASLKNM